MNNINKQIQNDFLTKENHKLKDFLKNTQDTNTKVGQDLNSKLNTMHQENEFLKNQINTFHFEQTQQFSGQSNFEQTQPFSTKFNLNQAQPIPSQFSFQQTETNNCFNNLNNPRLHRDRIEIIKSQIISDTQNQDPVIGLYKKPGVNYGRPLSLGKRNGIYFMNGNNNPSYVPKKERLSTIEWLC